MVYILINSLTEGGAEKVVLTLLGEFKEAGVEVELVCLEKIAFYAPPEGIKVHYLTPFEEIKNGAMKMFYLWVCARRLKAMVNENNVTLVQSHLIRSNYVNVFAQILGARHRSQLVIHNMIGTDQKGKSNSPLIRYFYSRADEVISLSKMMREHWSLYFNQKEEGQHRVIANPHSISHIHELLSEPPENFFFDQEKKYIVFVGRLIPLKRIGNILEAFHEVSKRKKDVEVVVLGDGSERKRLQEKSRELGIANKVHFVGKVNNPFAFMARSNVFVLASETEGLPNVLIEALACGVPIVSSDCRSGPREILSPDSDFRHQLTDELEYAEYGILFPVGRSDLMAEAFNRLLDDEEMTEEYSHKGLERAREYDAHIIAGRYLKSFEKLELERA